jgi:hypothetical protein
MRTFLVLVALAAAWAFAASEVRSRSEGIIQGTVTNGSWDGAPTGDLQITLLGGSGPSKQSITRTSGLGRFRFDGLSTSVDDVYAVAASYQGVDYSVTGIQPTPGDPVVKVQVRIYETTTSTEALNVRLDHHIVKADPGEQRLEVINFVKVTNRGDRTVVAAEASIGPSERSLLSLPQEAESLLLFGGSAGKVPGEGVGLAVNQAIPPGEQEILLAYHLPYASGSLLFRKPVEYPTDKAVFLLAADDIEAQSQQLGAIKEIDSAAGPYQLLSGEDLSAGTALEVTLTGLPAGGGSWLGDVLLPGAAILVIVGLGVAVLYVRSRGGRVSPLEE